MEGVHLEDDGAAGVSVWLELHDAKEAEADPSKRENQLEPWDSFDAGEVSYLDADELSYHAQYHVQGPSRHRLDIAADSKDFIDPFVTIDSDACIDDGDGLCQDLLADSKELTEPFVTIDSDACIDGADGPSQQDLLADSKELSELFVTIDSDACIDGADGPSQQDLLADSKELTEPFVTIDSDACIDGADGPSRQDLLADSKELSELFVTIDSDACIDGADGPSRQELVAGSKELTELFVTIDSDECIDGADGPSQDLTEPFVTIDSDECIDGADRPSQDIMAEIRELMGHWETIDADACINDRGHDNGPPQDTLLSLGSSNAHSVVPQASRQKEASKTSSNGSAATRKKSVFVFRDICFTVKHKKCWIRRDGTETRINENISARIESGHVLAIMGPSGAGKTTLINALTLSAIGGRTTGNVELDGSPLTEDVLRRRCYVVAQKDFHWAFLTCREILEYAADLYLVDLPRSDRAQMVDDVTSRLGLTSCEHTIAGNEFMKGLSGGQKRRLSLGVALLKSPDLVFLDEPTSGLDAASAANVMLSIKEVATRENLIVITTIHQPSTAVFKSFDKVMLLSQGREAFVGDAYETMDWFASLGHPIRPNTNPADHCLDLVNADFAPPDAVTEFLDAWEARRERPSLYVHLEGDDDEVNFESEGGEVSAAGGKGRWHNVAFETMTLLRRHTRLALRDPMLYTGRCVGMLLASSFFAVIYVRSRERAQGQVIHKMYLMGWMIGPQALFAMIAVYAYSVEFHAVRREAKNGMVSPFAYLIANGLLQLPFMFLFSLCSLGLPAYVIAGFNFPNCGLTLVIHAAGLYPWEAFAQLLSIVFHNPLVGMLCFLQFWFFGFIFAGVLIQVRHIIWPVDHIAYVLPLRYSLRSLVYLEFMDTEFEACDLIAAPVCYGDPRIEGSQAGSDVLDALGQVTGPFSSKNTLAKDALVPLSLGAGLKILHAVLLIRKMRKSSKVHSRLARSGALRRI